MPTCPPPASGRRRLFLVSLNLGLTYLNYRGLHVVGEAALGMTVFTLVPFVVLCMLGEQEPSACVSAAAATGAALVPPGLLLGVHARGWLEPTWPPPPRVRSRLQACRM